MRSALTRRWLVCGELGLWHRPQAGIEFTADGRVLLLGWGSALESALVPLPGADNQGTYELDQGGTLSLRYDLGGTMTTGPQLSADGRGLSFSSIGAFHYDYVAADEVDLSGVVLPSPPAPSPVPHPSCEGPLGTARPMESIAQLRAASARRWILCTPWGLLGERVISGEAGIELGTDDRYHQLVWGADGQLVRSGSPLAVEYLDTSAVNRRPTIQANYAVGSGTVIAVPVVTTNPAYLIINGGGEHRYHYRAVD